MNSPVFTTSAVMRAALAEAITCSPEELQETIGQVVVAEAAAMPLSARIGKGSRSLYDPESRTTALLADLIPAGQEAIAIAQEIARWHGRAAVATLMGESAAQGAVIEDGSGAVLFPVDGFNVRMLRSGDRYGLNDGLLYDNAEPSVEFYDAAQSPEKFGLRGQFVSRYLASTLVTHSSYEGLLLDTGSPTWVVSAQAMRRVNGLIREELQVGSPDAVPVSREERASMLAVLEQKEIGVHDFVLATNSSNSQIKLAIGTIEGISLKGKVQLRLLHVLRSWGADGHGRPDKMLVQAHHAGLGRYSDFAVESLIKIQPGDVPALTRSTASDLLAMVGSGDVSAQAKLSAEAPSSAQLTSLSRRVGDVAHGSYSESALRDAEKVLRSQPASERVVDGLITISKALRGEDYAHHDLQDVAVGISHLAAGRGYEGEALLKESGMASAEVQGLADRAAVEVPSLPAAADISTAPRDRVILTDCGLARYVDQRFFGSPVENGWYLCEPSGFIISGGEEGMGISMTDPKRWMEFGPIAEHLACEKPNAKPSPFVTSETVHVAQVSYFWTERKLHDDDYKIQVWDAVRKAVEKAAKTHDVIQNTSFAGQWEGVELFGPTLAVVTAAANDVARVLARFKDVVPIHSEPGNESAPGPGL